jgi:(p)ppGpp synthase/HD superfamily hydrolase
MAPEPAFSRYRDALNLAAELHGNELRKAWPAPLLAHLVAVSSLVWEDGGDEEQAVAALLHDALVYGGCSLEAIGNRFGPRVAQIAREATDTRQAFDAGPRPPWLERRVAHIASIATLSDDVLLVMAADKAQECQEWSLQLDRDPARAAQLQGGVEPMAWYYQSLHQALSNRIPNSRSLLILQRSVRALTNHCEVASTDAPLLLESWLTAYPQRHRPELFL